MVAISLYRGNLHRVPDVPRQWLMPSRKISLKDFKTLLHRRSKALSLLRSTTTVTTSNPNLKQEEEEGPSNDDNSGSDPPQLQLDPPKVEGISKDQKESNDGDCSVKPIDKFETSDDARPIVSENTPHQVQAVGNLENEKTVAPVNPSLETSNKENALNGKEERKREVEAKLQILNARKHNLVQVLRQILNAEEELKRRSSMQGMVVRPHVPLQVDVSNDSGSMTRHVTPRMGSEGNLGGDVEGGEADDFSNQNMQSHHLLRIGSTTPSSDSPHRRPAYNVVPHPSRATLGASASPSRFAPTGQQGHPANLPTVSVSGTNYIASSPSPAASGGTSVFRDSRLPSPWN